MKKILILLPGTFSRRAYLRFGIEALEKNFFVKTLDFTPWLYPKLNESYSNKNFYFEHNVTISSEKDLLNLLNKTYPDIVIDALQNDKEKYVNLNYDQSKNKFIIDGSSYKGEANTDSIIGNWWNHKILEADQQISPLSGSIKEQVVTFIGKENIELYGKNYLTDHFKLKSKNQDLPNDKKLDFDIWLDKKNNLILKVVYTRMGGWEYRLKSFE